MSTGGSGQKALLEDLRKERILAVVRTPTPESALLAARAAEAGGFRWIEITWNVPGAADVIRELARSKAITLGAGTILTAADARAAIDAGARYIVSPVADEEVMRETKSRGAVMVAGAATPTEVLRAHRLGSDMVKVFPAASLGGPAHLKFLLGPMPFLALLPTGGIEVGNIGAYLDAGALAVGATGALYPKDLLERGDYAAITEIARKMIAAARLGA